MNTSKLVKPSQVPAYTLGTATAPSEPIQYSQCQEAVRRLNEYLSHELRPDEAELVHEHLNRCRGCFAMFKFEETLLRTIRERAHMVSAPPYLRSHILQLLEQPAEAVGSQPQG